MRSDAAAALGICRRRGLGNVRHLAVGDFWVQATGLKDPLERLDHIRQLIALSTPPNEPPATYASALEVHNAPARVQLRRGTDKARRGGVRLDTARKQRRHSGQAPVTYGATITITTL